MFLTAAAVADQMGDQRQNQEAVSIQGGQTVYPAHVQYVDGNDPGLYATTNGQMYDC